MIPKISNHTQTPLGVLKDALVKNISKKLSTKVETLKTINLSKNNSTS
jgi:hypothetical protein